MLGFMDRGAIVFEYGNSLRAEAKAAGVEDAFRMRSFVDLYIRPLFCQGIGPFRWIAVSGDPQDIYTIDDMILETFSSNHPISSWIGKAREHVKFTGIAGAHRLARLRRAQPSCAGWSTKPLPAAGSPRRSLSPAIISTPARRRFRIVRPRT